MEKNSFLPPRDAVSTISRQPTTEQKENAYGFHFYESQYPQIPGQTGRKGKDAGASPGAPCRANLIDWEDS